MIADVDIEGLIRFPLVGRDAHRQKIEQALQQNKIVSIKGFSGVGKLHLTALIISEGASNHGGVWHTCTTTSQADELLVAVVSYLQLDISATDGELSEKIARYKPIIVLDNASAILDNDRHARYMGAITRMNDFKQGVPLLREAAALAERHNFVKVKFDVYNNLGTYLNDTGEYAQTRDYLLKTVALAEESQHHQISIVGRYNLAQSYNLDTPRNPQEAYKAARRGLDLAVETKFSFAIPLLFMELYESLRAGSDSDIQPTEPLMTQHALLDEASNDPEYHEDVVEIVTGLRGELAVDEHDIDGAEELLTAALAEAEINNDEIVRTIALYNRARIANMRDDAAAARTLAQAALKALPRQGQLNTTYKRRIESLLEAL